MKTIFCLNNKIIKEIDGNGTTAFVTELTDDFHDFSSMKIGFKYTCLCGGESEIFWSPEKTINSNGLIISLPAINDNIDFTFKNNFCIYDDVCFEVNGIGNYTNIAIDTQLFVDGNLVDQSESAFLNYRFTDTETHNVAVVVKYSSGSYTYEIKSESKVVQAAMPTINDRLEMTCDPIIYVGKEATFNVEGVDAYYGVTTRIKLAVDNKVVATSDSFTTKYTFNDIDKHQVFIGVDYILNGEVIDTKYTRRKSIQAIPFIDDKIDFTYVPGIRVGKEITFNVQGIGEYPGVTTEAKLYINGTVVAKGNESQFKYTFDEPNIYRVKVEIDYIFEGRVIKTISSDIKNVSVNSLSTLIKDKIDVSFDSKVKVNEYIGFKVTGVNKYSGVTTKAMLYINGELAATNNALAFNYKFRKTGTFTVQVKVEYSDGVNVITKFSSEKTITVVANIYYPNVVSNPSSKSLILRSNELKTRKFYQLPRIFDI